jgi:hypothetical protein
LAVAASVIIWLVLALAIRSWPDWAIRGDRLRCEDYVAPPDQIVYDEHRFSGVDEACVAHGNFRVTVPRCWINLVEASRLGVMFDPSENAGSASPPIFLHRSRINDSRPWGILYVAARGWEAATRYRFAYWYEAPVDGSMYATSIGIGRLAVKDCSQSGFSVMAGVLDAGDSSHFSLRYSVNGAMGTIDGWLSSTTEKFVVNLKVRDGPLSLGG